MARHTPVPPGRPRPAPDPHHHPSPGDPQALPEIVDENSEACWALWREATGAPANWEADTVPMELRPED